MPADLQAILFAGAAFASLATLAVHTFVGGVYVARPLLADATLPRASKWLNYYCWHITTILLAGMSGAFAYSAIRPDRPELAVFVTCLAFLLSGLSAAVALRGSINPFRFPSTSLFLLTAVLGTSGLAAG